MGTLINFFNWKSSGTVELENDYQQANSKCISILPKDGGIKHYAKLSACSAVAISRIASGNVSGLVFLDFAITIHFFSRLHLFTLLKNIEKNTLNEFMTSYDNYIKSLLFDENIISKMPISTREKVYNDRINYYELLLRNNQDATFSLIDRCSEVIRFDMKHNKYTPISKMPLIIRDIFENTADVMTFKAVLNEALHNIEISFEDLPDMLED